MMYLLAECRNMCTCISLDTYEWNIPDIEVINAPNAGEMYLILMEWTL